MSRVVHFEIPAKNAEQSAEFYKNVFGWEISKWDGPMEYWLIKTGEKDEPGIDGAIYQVNPMMDKTVNTVAVSDLSAMIEKVKSNGGTIATDVMTIPGIGIMVYALDKEGVIFGMLQPDKM
ncbi:MAG: VOC family protein [Bacteroidota bacterium]|jgi:hypothetical protein